jgi:hypothetical protein
MFKFLILLLIFNLSCSFKKNPLSNQKREGHSELYSEPDSPKKFDQSNLKRIIVAGSSGIEGHFSPHIMSYKDHSKEENQEIAIGGIDAQMAYLKILREEYENVLLLDAGNIFSSQHDFPTILQNYRDLNYDGITFGVNDFNIQLPRPKLTTPQLMKSFASQAKTPILLSNVFDLKTAKKIDWKGVQPHIIKEINGIKIGILGILPNEVSKLSPFNNRVGLFIEDMLKSTLAEARVLRSMGAQAIIVLTNQTLDCGQAQAIESKLAIKKVNFEPRKNNVCDLSSPLGQFLLRLPPRLVDVVITGRTQEKVANYVNGTLVLGAYGQGKSLIYSELFFDSTTNSFLTDQTIVHQPVYFCREFFKETNDCFTEDSSIDHEKRIPASFLGKKIELEKVQPLKKSTSIHINFDKALEDLRTDIIYKPQEINHSQIVVINISGLELMDLLEEDVNSGNQGRWFPVQFSSKEDQLQLKIHHQLILSENNYKVATDLKSILNNSKLHQLMLETNNAETNHLSWNSFGPEDTLSTHLSSLKR